MKRLTHFSLCSGIGGLDLAAEMAGFKTVAQCEIDEYASRVLAKNFKGVPNLHDIRAVTNERLAACGVNAQEITVISAGFPCQPYSLAGKGLGDRDGRDLWGEVARVLGEVKPPWFVGENTPGLFARQNQRYFRRVLYDLTALGYTVGWGIWGACDVGAPHRRARVFFMAHADGERRKQDDFVEQSVGEALGEKRRKDKPGGTDRISRTVSDADSLWKQQSERQQSKGRRRACDICRDEGAWLWQTEPDVGRVADGVPARVDRLRCLGNAVVPAQAYPIFKSIAKYEAMNNSEFPKD